jgi:hypothetical protein
LRGFIILARLKSSVYLVAILLMVSVAAKAVGSLQPINPALRGFVEGCEDKPQPCWYGIVPGKTRSEDGQKILEKEGYQQSPTASFISSFLTTANPPVCKKIVFLEGGLPDGNMVAFTIVLSQCSGLKSGDLMSILGTPHMSLAASLMLYQESGVTVLFDRKAKWLTSPFVEVDSLRLQFIILNKEIIWSGFKPGWKHCKNNLTTIGC